MVVIFFILLKYEYFEESTSTCTSVVCNKSITVPSPAKQESRNSYNTWLLGEIY